MNTSWKKFFFRKSAKHSQAATSEIDKLELVQVNENGLEKAIVSVVYESF